MGCAIRLLVRDGGWSISEGGVGWEGLNAKFNEFVGKELTERRIWL